MVITPEMVEDSRGWSEMLERASRDFGEAARDILEGLRYGPPVPRPVLPEWVDPVCPKCGYCLEEDDLPF